MNMLGTVGLTRSDWKLKGQNRDYVYMVCRSWDFTGDAVLPWAGVGGLRVFQTSFCFSFASKEPKLDFKWRRNALFGLWMKSRGRRGCKCEKLFCKLEQFFWHPLKVIGCITFAPIGALYVTLRHGVALTFCFFTQSNGTMSKYYRINATERNICFSSSKQTDKNATSIQTQYYYSMQLLQLLRYARTSWHTFVCPSVNLRKKFRPHEQYLNYPRIMSDPHIVYCQNEDDVFRHTVMTNENTKTKTKIRPDHIFLNLVNLNLEMAFLFHMLEHIHIPRHPCFKEWYQGRLSYILLNYYVEKRSLVRSSKDKVYPVQKLCKHCIASPGTTTDALELWPDMFQPIGCCSDNLNTFLSSWSFIFLFLFLGLQAMGCCGIKGDKEGEEDDKRARKQNKEIEKQIQKDKQVMMMMIIILMMITMIMVMMTRKRRRKADSDAKSLLVILRWFFLWADHLSLDFNERTKRSKTAQCNGDDFDDDNDVCGKKVSRGCPNI